MCNQTFLNKAANCARENITGGFDYPVAIGIAAASCGCTAHEISHELQRRSAEKKARNRKKQLEIDAYWERQARYEN